MAYPDFLSEPYSEPDLDTYSTFLTDVLRTFLLLQLMHNEVTLRSDAQRTDILGSIWAFTDAEKQFSVDA